MDQLRNLVLIALGAAALGACSGSGPSSTQTDPDFAVSGISVVEGDVWQVNRAIRIDFNKDVDFGTVNLNTISITDQFGNSAIGAFSQGVAPGGAPQENVVLFQPSCPVLDDFSDAGLTPGGIAYALAIRGSLTSGVTVRSQAGDVLEEGQQVNFTTPLGDQALQLFLDTVGGPPAVVLRGSAGTALDELQATYLELGGDPENRVYFELDVDPSSPTSQLGVLPTGFRVPLNKYSESDSSVAVAVFINQPIQAGPANVNTDFVQFEYQEPGGDWLPITTTVELEANCVESGSILRVTPTGILPQNTELRINLRQGFSDLTGDSTPSDRDRFARMVTVDIDNPDLGDSEVDSDEVLESFLLSGSVDGSLEDQSSTLDAPRANWSEGRLEAAFDFEGTGGTNGIFDYNLIPGQEVVVNTDSGTIVGGLGGDTSQAVIAGVLDVRNLSVPVGAKLSFVGSSPVTILASGSVNVAGHISVDGSGNFGVNNVDVTNVPEPGSVGNAGGGTGGTGSPLASQSSPSGTAGNGAFNAPSMGGGGGEASYDDLGIAGRRGAGGGGGRLGADYFYDHDAGLDFDLVECQTLIGLDAEPGFGGGENGLGAISQATQAAGGDVGPAPFFDDDETNNFFGSIVTSGGQLITGELQQPWAGAGGGGGGDAVDSAVFPLIPFSDQGDERGAGGGGGGGGLRILAIGSIVVEATGRITADGGHGGGGENTVEFNRVGGGSGGGSGGHIILASGSFIEVRGDAQGAGFWYRDDGAAMNHFPRSLSAVGGQGGAGHANDGGARENGPTTWRCDAIPLDRVNLPDLGNDDDVPPFRNFNDEPNNNPNCFGMHPDLNRPGGPVFGAGGDGSPGIIQLHVDDPVTNLRFPSIDGGVRVWGGTPDIGNPGQVINNIDATRVTAPPPLGWTEPTLPTDNFLPFFSRFSVAQSDWIPLGLARVVDGAVNGQVSFRFGGTLVNDGATNPGRLLRTADMVDMLPPLLGPATLNTDGTVPFLGDEGFTAVFDGSGLEDIYKANVSLLSLFSVELTSNVDPTNSLRFQIASAEYDPATDRLTCTTSTGDGSMQAFVSVAGGDVAAALLRHDFRVVTAGVRDIYPVGTRIQILFDATVADPVTGLPSESLSFSATNPVTLGAPTSDITLFNGPPVNPPTADFEGWDFVRFRVQFDLNSTGDANGVPLGAPRPGLDFIRLPFQFQ